LPDNLGLELYKKFLAYIKNLADGGKMPIKHIIEFYPRETIGALTADEWRGIFLPLVNSFVAEIDSAFEYQKVSEQKYEFTY